MTSESFAELLFFARAAVEADPALANARIDLPLGRVLIQGRPDRPDDPPLTIAGLYRVWDDHAVQVPCPRCGAPRLFLDASGGGMHRLVAFVHRLCPFCRETNHGHESPWANFRAVRDAVRSAREAAGSRRLRWRSGTSPSTKPSPLPCRSGRRSSCSGPPSPPWSSAREVAHPPEGTTRIARERAVDNFLLDLC